MQTATQNELTDSATAKKILLVDGSNLAFRMYFALERTGLTSPGGKPSWAIFGFFKALLDVIERYKPTSIVAAFDRKEPTFRHEAFDFYKANRPDEMPEALALQWPEIKRGLALIGMNLVELAGFEADDLIGTLSLQAENSGWEVLIFSGDKDNLQLVSDKVKILMPGQKGIQLVDREETKVKIGVYPELVVDFKALCGDPSDNIPGVPGIGPKTAIKLLEEFPSLDDIYSNIENVKPASVQKKLVEGRDSAFDSRYLAQIKTDCQITYPFEELAHPLNPDLDELTKFLKEYQLASLERKLPKIFEKLGVHEDSKKNSSSGMQMGFLAQSEETETQNNENQNQGSALQIGRKTIFDEEALDEVLKQISEATLVTIDLETDSLNTRECNIVGWALGWKNPKEEEIQSVYIPTGHTYLGVPEQLDNELVAKKITDFLKVWKGRLIAQNSKFEYKILQRFGVILPDNTLDTMLASYLHNPDDSHGLKNQALRVLGYRMKQIDELIGPKGKNQKTMNFVPIEATSDYACDDAALTLALAEHYLGSLTDKLEELWLDLESPLALLIARMELNGVRVNSEKLLKLSDELAKQITDLEHRTIEKLGVGHFNLNSSQQLGQILSEKGFKLSKTAGGQLSTDGKVLYELIAEDETGVIKEIIEHRGLSKMRSTYTDSLIKQINSSTGRVHGEFNQALTATGRLSSSNPNLQNIPIKDQKYGQLIRSCFEAEPGKVLISADYSQIELRILAHITQDPTLVDAFQKGQDVHLRTAAEIFEVAPENVTSEMRRLGKTLNFALLYQQGAFATARQLGISNKEATTFIEKYFESFPTIKPLMEKTLEEARKTGYVETLWGRRRYFANLNSSVAVLRKMDERAAFNAPLQGTAADLMKKAMLSVERAIKDKGLDAKLILQVHDEIVVETLKEQEEQVIELLRQEMVIGQPFKVPIVIDVAVGSNWAECG
ncbi:MAG: DNA polymerase I [Candidatus Caenarcaniphilales bacterium]|nr:DNA polymerase I [Candidatus Caenarcaniphilales bacterium]